MLGDFKRGNESRVPTPSGVQMQKSRFLLARTAVVRSKRALAVAAVVAMTLPIAPTHAQQVPSVPPANPINGVWIDDTGGGAIEVAPCGTRLCGRIVWLKAPIDKAGRPLTDDYNPQAGQRNRPICGLPVIGDLQQQRNGAWDAGWIYDPKVGKSYDVELKLRSPDRLQVTGYIGTKFFSETFIWTRAPATLPRCITATTPTSAKL